MELFPSQILYISASRAFLNTSDMPFYGMGVFMFGNKSCPAILGPVYHDSPLHHTYL